MFYFVPTVRQWVGLLGLAFSGRPASATLHERAAPPPGPLPRRVVRASFLLIPGSVSWSVSPNFLLPPASRGVRVARLGPL